VSRSRRPSVQTALVLRALTHDPSAWRYGYELGVEIGLKSGSLYPILMRLADRGLLETSWENEPPEGRPRRHLYRLTAAGIAFANQLPSARQATPRRRPRHLPSVP
jgi:PadR family transcriptional regulator, regulatory protein PadR